MKTTDIASDPTPIRTEADYDAALAEVERLWGAASGTPEGVRLDMLTAQIETYETQHYPLGSSPLPSGQAE